MKGAPQASVGTLTIGDSVEKARRLFDERCAQLEASPCTFYVRDPIWKGEYRLLLMHGVRHPDPMYGFLHSSDAKRILVGDPSEEFVTSVRKNKRLFHSTTHVRDANGSKRANLLFGNFIERESVVSCARLHYRPPGSPLEAVLFLNYRKKKDFLSKDQNAAQTLLRDLTQFLPGIDRELVATSSYLHALPLLLDPIQSLSSIGIGNEDTCIDDQLEKILASALEAFDITPDDGIGTIHLYEPTRKMLRLAAVTTNGHTLPAEQSVEDRQGIISWVADRRRAILIMNRHESTFGKIYVPSGEDYVSEIAVPLLAGDEVLGVVDLESRMPGAFQPESVRLLWYAGNAAAIALRLSKELQEKKKRIQHTSAMLKLCHSASVTVSGPRRHLDSLARTLRDTLKADACDIWLPAEGGHKWKSCGGAPPVEKVLAEPRDRGWTRRIVRSATAMYISKIRSHKIFDLQCWNDEKGVWEASTVKKMALNAGIDVSSCGAMLGFPLPLAEKTAAAAWLKFGSAEILGLEETTRVLLGIYAQQAGLVVDCLRKDQERLSRKYERRTKKQMHARLFGSGPVDLKTCRCIEGYFLSSPCDSALGGDFHAHWLIDPETAGFLLGDAEGHGVSGALHMLPMIATCTAAYAGHTSTYPMMSKLMRVCSQLEMRGTAAYLIVRRIGDELHAFSSVAGHHPFIIFRKAGGEDFIPADGSLARCLPLGLEPRAFAEDRVQVFPGDLIVGYTDGVYEAISEKREFGIQGIKGAVLKNREPDVQKIAETVMSDAREWGGGVLDDDATVMVVRVKEAPPSRSQGTRKKAKVVAPDGADRSEVAGGEGEEGAAGA